MFLWRFAEEKAEIYIKSSDFGKCCHLNFRGNKNTMTLFLVKMYYKIPLNPLQKQRFQEFKKIKVPQL